MTGTVGTYQNYAFKSRYASSVRETYLVRYCQNGYLISGMRNVPCYVSYFIVIISTIYHIVGISLIGTNSGRDTNAYKSMQSAVYMYYYISQIQKYSSDVNKTPIHVDILLSNDYAAEHAQK